MGACNMAIYLDKDCGLCLFDRSVPFLLFTMPYSTKKNSECKKAPAVSLFLDVVKSNYNNFILRSCFFEYLVTMRFGF